MPAVDLTNAQIASLVRQLSTSDKREVLFDLASDANGTFAEGRLRREQLFRDYCAERGLEYDAMTDEDRIAVIDEAVHNNRACH